MFWWKSTPASRVRAHAISLATVATLGIAAPIMFGCSDSDTPSAPVSQTMMPCTQFAQYLHIDATVDTQGDTRRAARKGDVVYAADGVSGVQVIDISDTRRPFIASTVSTPSSATDVVVFADLLCVATVSDGVRVYDIATPLAPGFAGGLATSGQALGLSLADTLLYIADDGVGLEVVSVNDPSNPRLIGVENTSGKAQDLVVVGPMAYVSDDVLGLRVVDVSIPAAPFLRTSLSLPGQPQGIAAAGHIVFVAAGGQIDVIDVGDPDRPIIVGMVPTPNGSQDIEVSGERGYVAERFGGVRILNLSAPSAPTSIGSFDTPGEARGVNVMGDLLMVSDPGLGISFDGVEFVSIANPELAPVVAARPTPGATGEALGAFLVGGALYVCDGPAGVAIADVSDPEQPRFQSSISIAGAHDLATRGSTAYIAGDNAVAVVDVSDPFSPNVLTQVLPAANRVTAHDSLLFLTQDLGVIVYRFDASGTPQFLDALPSTQAAFDVAVIGEFAYCAWGNSGVQVMELARLGVLNPIVWSVPTEASARGIAVVDHYLVVAVSVRGVQIFDIQAPSRPVAVAALETPGSASYVVVEGETAYVADESGGVQIVDLRDPTDPRILGTLVAPSRVSGLDADGFFVYAVARDDGLIIARAQCSN